MYLLQRKKIYIYANISLFLSYSEVTVATRSGPYPAQIVTAVTRSSPYPDQMVDQHLETTTTALNISGDQDPQMSPRDRSPVRTPSPRHPSGKDPWNQWTTYTLTLLQLEQLAGGELVPRLSLVSPKFFFSVLSPMEVFAPCRCRLRLA